MSGPRGGIRKAKGREAITTELGGGGGGADRGASAGVEGMSVRGGATVSLWRVCGGGYGGVGSGGGGGGGVSSGGGGYGTYLTRCSSKSSE